MMFMWLSSVLFSQYFLLCIKIHPTTAGETRHGSSQGDPAPISPSFFAVDGTIGRWQNGNVLFQYICHFVQQKKQKSYEIIKNSNCLPIGLDTMCCCWNIIAHFPGGYLDWIGWSLQFVFGVNQFPCRLPGDPTRRTNWWKLGRCASRWFTDPSRLKKQWLQPLPEPHSWIWPKHSNKQMIP